MAYISVENRAGHFQSTEDISKIRAQHAGIAYVANIMCKRKVHILWYGILILYMNIPSTLRQSL